MVQSVARPAFAETPTPRDTKIIKICVIVKCWIGGAWTFKKVCWVWQDNPGWDQRVEDAEPTQDQARQQSLQQPETPDEDEDPRDVTLYPQDRATSSHTVGASALSDPDIEVDEVEVDDGSSASWVVDGKTVTIDA